MLASNTQRSTYLCLLNAGITGLCHYAWSFKNYFHLFIFMCIGVLSCPLSFVSVCLCTICVPGTHEGQRRALDPLELELQTAVSFHAAAGNWTQVLWRVVGALTPELSPAHHPTFSADIGSMQDNPVRGLQSWSKDGCRQLWFHFS